MKKTFRIFCKTRNKLKEPDEHFKQFCASKSMRNNFLVPMFYFLTTNQRKEKLQKISGQQL